MPLRDYRGKRNFERTPEPRGAQRRRRARSGLRFTVQKHAARSLHYDFRLEHGGVLWSWAVPKGPSLDPRVKRLAVQVEDHPLEYGSFEGTIPQGEYGGGSVLVWDTGKWQPEGDAEQGRARGRLDFTLDGEKLRGRWHLVRTRPRRGNADGRTWLLIKGRDQEARNEAGRGALQRRAEVAPEQPAETEKNAVRIALTHPDRVLFEDASITKRGLADYYAAVADWMLPHLAGRSLTLLRCPEGAGKGGFFQKHKTRGQPEAIHGVDVRERSGVRTYMTVVDAAGLGALVQLGALEIHTWGARAPDLLHPDLLTFDLDPDPSVPWAHTVEAARELRELLGELGLASFAKTTGGKGLHLVVPIEPRASWDEAREFARAAVETLVARSPERYLAKASKKARRGKIFLDYLRNAQGATAVCPYSTRAQPGAPVATPIAWSELGPRLDPRKFDPRSVLRRLAQLGQDPWEGYTRLRQTLPR